MSTIISLQLDFTENDLLELDALGSALGITSRAGIIKSGLDVLRWVIERKKEGDVILAVNRTQTMKRELELITSSEQKETDEELRNRLCSLSKGNHYWVEAIGNTSGVDLDKIADVLGTRRMTK